MILNSVCDENVDVNKVFAILFRGFGNYFGFADFSPVSPRVLRPSVSLVGGGISTPLVSNR